MQSSAPNRPSQINSSQAAEASETSESCPYLGTSTGPGTAHEFSSDVHKCFSTRLPVPISTIHQENYCLSPLYETCPVYREKSARAAGATYAPLAAVGASTLNGPAWAGMATPTNGNADVTAGVAVAGAAIAGGATTAPWGVPAHPDFQADIDLASARRRSSRQINLRPILIALLLLALIPVGWWLWTNVRPGVDEATGFVPGTVITMPTLMATSEIAGDGSDGGSVAAVVPQASPESGVAAAAATNPTTNPTAEATPEATASALENIAATATALFANATAVVDCAAPSWWTAYSVEAGDSIEALAAGRGIPPEELIVANCLAGPDLEVGSTLLLPPVGVIALLLETATPVPTSTAVRPTRAPVLPTRPPVFFPTPTFPVFIFPTPQLPTFEPTDPPATRPPVRPTAAPTRTPIVPTSVAQPTATAPNPFPSATAPNPFLTPTAFATSTPPSIGGSVTPTPTGTPATPTLTPPSVP